MGRGPLNSRVPSSFSDVQAFSPLAGGRLVDFYSFFSWTLTVTAVVTLFWPLNIPLAALAYKVRLGDQPMPLEPRPFWLRSTFAALGLALASLVALGLTFALARGAGFPMGPIHLVIVML